MSRKYAGPAAFRYTSKSLLASEKPQLHYLKPSHDTDVTTDFNRDAQILGRMHFIPLIL